MKKEVVARNGRYHHQCKSRFRPHNPIIFQAAPTTNVGIVCKSGQPLFHFIALCYNGAMIDPLDLISILTHLRNQIQVENVRITIHAQQEMLEEQISLDDVYAAIQVGQIIENYPGHRRGVCCLIYGDINSGHAIHVVCTTINTTLIVITAYRPKPPKWITSTQRKVS